MPVDQYFCKPLDTEARGPMDEKDKLEPEINIYS